MIFDSLPDYGQPDSFNHSVSDLLNFEMYSLVKYSNHWEGAPLNTGAFLADETT